MIRLLILLLFYSLNQVASDEYYIIVNSTDHCTTQCQTLSQFVTNSTHDLLDSDVTLVFSPGVHYLNSNLTVSNSDNFVMTSQNLTAEIRCARFSQVVFNHSLNVEITNLEFVGCGDIQALRVDEFVAHNATFRGQEYGRTTLQLIETTAQIINCTFPSNRNGHAIFVQEYSSFYCYYDSLQSSDAIIAIHSNIYISQSIFKNNGATCYGGSTIFAEQYSIIDINNSTFISNSAHRGILNLYSSSTTIEQSIFEDNTVGAAVSLFYGSNAKIYDSEFYNNNASIGVLYSLNSSGTIEKSIFEDNLGDIILLYDGSDINLYTSDFHNNSPSYFGVIYLFMNSSATVEKSIFEYNIGIISLITDNSDIRIGMCEFKHNTGSVVLSNSSKVEITTSTFDNNTEAATAGFPTLSEGTILGSSGGSLIIVNDSNFTNNNSSVMLALSSTIEHYNSLLIMNNSAAENGFAIIQLHNSKFIGHHSGNATISDNFRSLIAFNSNVTFMGNVKFSNNQQPLSITNSYFQEGGAITLVQSSIYLNGISSFEHNYAENGGAIFSTESKFYIQGDVTVAHNMANNGGGIYLIESELNCLNKSTIILFNNTATHKGGGIHAISSFVKITSVLPSSAILNFVNNIAERGGGLSLEANAKLVTEKYLYSIGLPFTYPSYPQSYTTIFSANSADYGGAVYVDDDTNSGTCTIDPKTECFFQVFAYLEGLYIHNSILDSILMSIQSDLKPLSLYFLENSASISGSALYGGLLDRCAVSQFAEVRIKYAEEYIDRGNGIQYLEHVSNITESDLSISSRPVKVCLCIDNKHNCTYQSRIEVKKGESFNVSITSIDQTNHPVNGLIHASLKFPESAVASGQATREIPAKCTNLTFNVLSPHSSEQLTLYDLDGPCRYVNLSKISLDINFLPCNCSIGLQIVEINRKTSCMCECHGNIRQHIEECDSNTGAFLRKSQSKAWISFTDNINLSGYLVYPNCPFDYCNFSLNLSIDLNQPNGADAQCAFNRSSLLCGSCQQNYSLSLGSSHCHQCPNHWPALFISISIAALLAGIALVALLLVLNMTVAVGTLNGLIFYANVVYANKNILLPFQEANFVTAFISWLNLELGIETCYFPAMDTFGKTWLQLAFPAYIILLVALVIIISSYSSRFSNLIGKKNPVATLATMILLSYAKLLEVCFKSLSFGNLKYPDGSIKKVWLPDATVEYLIGKHIVLFLAVVLILAVGLVYTVLLFSWQWLLHLPRWRIFRWSRDQKLQTFIETYHTPYTPKHRYWTGLLLLARAVLYLVAAVNVSNDPTVALTAIVVIVCGILVLKAFIGSRVYRKWPVDILETFFYLNILLFIMFTWYCLDECRNKKAAAYTSVIITFIVLLLIILYHIYTYTNALSKIKETKSVKMLKSLVTPATIDRKKEANLPPDDDAHGFHDLLDIIDRPINTNDYKIPVKKVEPTFSVVEVHHPQLAPPDPEESNA